MTTRRLHRAFTHLLRAIGHKLLGSWLAVLLTLALLPVAVPAAGDTTGQPDSMAAASCGPLQTLDAVDANGRPLCTHGEDGDLGTASAEIPLAVPSTAPCFDSPDTYRIEILYGVPADRTSRYEERVQLIRPGVAYVDQLFARSSGNTQHLKWLCAGSDVPVTEVPLPAVGADGVLTFNEMLSTVRGRTVGKKKTANPLYNRSDRIYVVFVEGSTNMLSQGSLDLDSTDSDDNANNVGPAYSMLHLGETKFSTLVGRIIDSLLHEIGHNLGAVQHDAPHTSGAGHCYDEFDIMCYEDGGPYFANGGKLTTPCPNPVDNFTLECGVGENPLYQDGDDYYSIAPPPGSYIDTHWNVACSRWVLGAIPC